MKLKSLPEYSVSISWSTDHDCWNDYNSLDGEIDRERLKTEYIRIPCECVTFEGDPLHQFGKTIEFDGLKFRIFEYEFSYDTFIVQHESQNVPPTVLYVWRLNEETRRIFLVVEAESEAEAVQMVLSANIDVTDCQRRSIQSSGVCFMAGKIEP